MTHRCSHRAQYCTSPLDRAGAPGPANLVSWICTPILSGIEFAPSSSLSGLLKILATRCWWIICEVAARLWNLSRVKTEVISALALSLRPATLSPALRAVRSSTVHSPQPSFCLPNHFIAPAASAVQATPPRPPRGAESQQPWGGVEIYLKCCNRCRDRCPGAQPLRSPARCTTSRCYIYRKIKNHLLLRKLDRKLRRNFFIFYPKNVCQRGAAGCGVGLDGRRQVPAQTRNLFFSAKMRSGTMPGPFPGRGKE